MKPIEGQFQNDFEQILDDRYNKKALIIASQLPVSDWYGLFKLEIESEKVDNIKDFRAQKHIRGVRLHFIPESYKGSPELYKDISFERVKDCPTCAE